MQVNQKGEPIEETYLLPFGDSSSMTLEELREALALVCDHLQVNIYRTNATKSGNVEIELRAEL